MSHLLDETTDTLRRLGWTYEIVTPSPTGDSDARRFAKACAHIAAALRAAKKGAPVLVLWPAFGWLDFAIWRWFESAIVVHDPVPLRAQPGYGRAARNVGARAVRAGRAVPVAHTRSAAEATRELLDLPEAPRVVLHPVSSQGRNVTRPASAPTVLVAGQFKPVRDLELLEALGPRLEDRKWCGRIVGRGWPELVGWEVVDRFVDEDELDAEIATASVILVPYRRYWQSGIAVRALELGRPVVGLETEFLRTTFGASHPGFVRSAETVNDWLEAIARVISEDAAVWQDARDRYVTAVDQSWIAMLGA